MERRIKLYISEEVKTKLKEKHHVAENEVVECFGNRVRTYLTDNREEHLTDPLTRWFIAPTDKDRILKVAFIPFIEILEYHIKSAFEPNDIEREIYAKESVAIGL